MSRKPIDEALIARMRKLRADGLSLERIAKKVGVSIETVRKYRSDEHAEKVKERMRRYGERQKQTRGRPPRRVEIRTASTVMRSLLEHMDENAVNNRAVARQIGIHRETFTEWKKGNTAPSILSVEALADVLGYELVLKPRE